MAQYLNALPSASTNTIKAALIYTDNTGRGQNTASAVTSTSDRLWLPAEYEINGAITSSNPNEASYMEQFQYFANGNPKAASHHANGSGVSWATRSPWASNSTAFVNVGGGRVMSNFVGACVCNGIRAVGMVA